MNKPDYISEADYAAYRAAQVSGIIGDSKITVNPAITRQKPECILTRGDNIEIQPIDWMWDGHLARGKMHITAGAPEAGKTNISIAIAAAITSGGCFPDGSRTGFKGNVIIWSGEDDPSDTIAPRLIAMGADMKRVYLISGMKDGDTSRQFDPSKDIDSLTEKVRIIGGADLIIIDPIVSAVSGDSHKNAETRRGLQPLVDLAQECKAALLGITHLTKGTSGRDPLERVTGSLAFGALARIVFFAAVNGQEEIDNGGPPRVFCRVKSNIGPSGGGFGYDVQEAVIDKGIKTSCVTWLAPLEGSARSILSRAENAQIDDDSTCPSSEASDFLLDQLSKGPVPTTDLKAAAEAHSISWRTVERAKHTLTKSGTILKAVQKKTETGKPKWLWEIVTSPHNPHTEEWRSGDVTNDEEVEF